MATSSPGNPEIQDRPLPPVTPATLVALKLKIADRRYKSLVTTVAMQLQIARCRK